MKTLCGWGWCNPLEEASDACLVHTASSEDGFEGPQDSHAAGGEAVVESLVVLAVVGIEEADHDCMVRATLAAAAAADSGWPKVEDSFLAADGLEAVAAVTDSVAVLAADRLGLVLAALVWAPLGLQHPVSRIQVPVMARLRWDSAEAVFPSL